MQVLPTLSLADEELPGFHEYSYEIPNGTVIELTYREGDKIVRKKVLMKTGTFISEITRASLLQSSTEKLQSFTTNPHHIPSFNYD